MEESQAIIAIEAGSLARMLPYQMMTLLTDDVSRCDLSDWPAARQRSVQNISHPHYRNLAADFLSLWKSKASDISPEAVALALRTAAEAEKVYHASQSLELVWTGPESGVAYRKQLCALSNYARGTRVQLLAWRYQNTLPEWL